MWKYFVILTTEGIHLSEKADRNKLRYETEIVWF